MLVYRSVPIFLQKGQQMLGTRAFFHDVWPEVQVRICLPKKNYGFRLQPLKNGDKAIPIFWQHLPKMSFPIMLLKGISIDMKRNGRYLMKTRKLFPQNRRTAMDPYPSGGEKSNLGSPGGSPSNSDILSWRFAWKRVLSPLSFTLRLSKIFSWWKY